MKSTATLLRLVTFQAKNASGSNVSRLGALLNRGDSKRVVLDLEKASNGAIAHKDMKSLLQDFTRSNSMIRDLVQKSQNDTNLIPLEDVQLKAPIANPGKIVCVGLNYKDHAEESNMPLPAIPVLFSKFDNTITGPDQDVAKPDQTNEMDYEVELVIVIGKGGKDIAKEKALSHVAGYTVGNDVSARDWQLKKPGAQWMMGKTFDSFAPIGPCIIVPAEGDGFNPQALKIKCTLNDQVVQDSNTNQLVFGIDHLVSYISQMVTLNPGDIIFTGTPPGVGFGRKPQLWMKKGDVVTCEIEEIGQITNRIV